MNTEPVLIFGLSKDYFVALISAVVAALVAFNVWEPTQAQLTAILGLFATVWAIVSTVVNQVVRSRVTPVERTAHSRRA